MQIIKKIYRIFFRGFFKFIIFIILYLILKIINIFLNKRLKFFSYVKTEVGTASWIDGFFRRLEFNNYDHRYICLISGTQVANIFFEELRIRKFKKYNIISIYNKFLVNLLGNIFVVKNEFNSELMYNMLSHEEYKNLPLTDWLGNNLENYNTEIKSALNIKKDDWFVCFFARDSNYDEIYRPQLAKLFNNRNADINTLVPSMEYVASQGGYAVRIGNTAKKKLKVTNKNIIDYSFSDIKNPRNDFLLMFFCKFCVGSGSGIIDLGNLNNVPTLIINNYEYIYKQGLSRGIFIPKLLIKQNGTILKYDEYVNAIGYPNNIQKLHDLIIKNRLKYKDNTFEDILELTKIFYRKYVKNEKNINIDESGHVIYKPFAEKYLS